MGWIGCFPREDNWRSDRFFGLAVIVCNINIDPQRRGIGVQNLGAN
jgi:hypothetical protein